ncbi:MAG: ribosome maturation factor RimM [Thermoanaerobaculia bacterium]|nr:ribosome maturation factor RimM [Thermoanaerobaculia bacterium]
MLLVGEIRRPHGLEGEVSVEAHTDFPQRFVAGAALVWKRGEKERPLVLESVRPHSGRLLMRFHGIASAEEASALTGGGLYVPEAESVDAPPDFYYSHAIEGWTCRDTAGREVGTVVGLEKTAAGALLELRTPSGRTTLVPFVRPIVVEIRAEDRLILLDPPDGLLEL